MSISKVLESGTLRFRLQEENASLKKLLEENNILYASSEMLDVTEVPDEYDEDQGARQVFGLVECRNDTIKVNGNLSLKRQ